MTTTPRSALSDKPARKQLTLSPEALAALRLPLEANAVGQIFLRGTGQHFASIFSAGNYHADAEIAAFIAALVNEALTRELPSAFEPAPEWAAEDILRREG